VLQIDGTPFVGKNRRVGILIFIGYLPIPFFLGAVRRFVEFIVIGQGG
jgi:hypothetical protein